MTGYARASAAEIVNGQVINDSDFNNEFNAILAAFHATTGHLHDGNTGEGPKISLTTSVSGVLPGLNGGVTTSASDPTVNDDVDTQAVAALWFNTTTKTLFYCADNTNGAAVWVKVQRLTSASAAPTVNADIDQGYIPGSIWLRTGVTPSQVYICVDNTNGAAVWVVLRRGRNHFAAADPTVNDDDTVGFERTSQWINTSDSGVFVCTDATTGAAVWTEMASVAYVTTAVAAVSAKRINPVSLFLGGF